MRYWLLSAVLCTVSGLRLREHDGELKDILKDYLRGESPTEKVGEEFMETPDDAQAKCDQLITEDHTDRATTSENGGAFLTYSGGVPDCIVLKVMRGGEKESDDFEQSQSPFLKGYKDWLNKLADVVKIRWVHIRGNDKTASAGLVFLKNQRVKIARGKSTSDFFGAKPQQQSTYVGQKGKPMVRRSQSMGSLNTNAGANDASQ